MNNYDYWFKYIIIGDTFVGKSCIMLQFVENKFENILDPTIGVEFGTKMITHKDLKIKFQIWDTAGQENYRSLTKGYYKGSIGVVLVFDITSKQSFNNINNWIEEIKNNTTKLISFILVGNKSDLKKNRNVSKEEAEDFARSIGIPYIESSAKNFENIDNIFYTLTDIILNKINEKKIIPEEECGIKIGTNIIKKPENNNTSSTCC